MVKYYLTNLDLVDFSSWEYTKAAARIWGWPLDNSYQSLTKMSGTTDLFNSSTIATTTIPWVNKLINNWLLIAMGYKCDMYYCFRA